MPSTSSSSRPARAATPCFVNVLPSTDASCDERAAPRGRGRRASRRAARAASPGRRAPRSARSAGTRRPRGRAGRGRAASARSRPRRAGRLRPGRGSRARSSSGRPGTSPSSRASIASTARAARARACVALPRPSRPALEPASGRASASTKIGKLRDHSSRYSTKSSRPGVRPLDVLEDEHARPLRRPAARRRAARRRTGPAARRRATRRARAAARAAARSSAAPRDRGRAARRRHASFGRAARARLVLADPGAHAHHLGERPVGDALAVGEAAAAVPPDLLDQAVHVLLELPGEARLADAGDPGRPRRGAPCAPRRLPWKSSLTRRSSRSRPTNGGSRPAERWAPPRRGQHAQRAAERHRLGLPLQLVLARRLVRDRRLGRPLRRLADEHGARARRPTGRGTRCSRGRRRPSPGRRHRPSRPPRRSARPRARRERGVELGHRGDEVERSAHRALGVVLVRDRRPPHRHHRVADELLDRAAVALDQPLRQCRSSGRGARACPRRRVPPTPTVNPTRSAKSTETSRRSAAGAAGATAAAGAG